MGHLYFSCINVATGKPISTHFKCAVTFLLFPLSFYPTTCSRSLIGEADTLIPAVSPPLPVPVSAAAATPWPATAEAVAVSAPEVHPCFFWHGREGHELGSGMVGKAQGFYIASSEDGNSQTKALTAMFESGGYTDSISFFGVHRTVVSEAQLAIMGGTGKYVNARGYAMIKTFPASSVKHNTDGDETILEFTVYGR